MGVDINKHKPGEEKLKDDKDRFRSVFDLATPGIAHIGADGRFLCLNQKYCDIVGYTIDELLEKTIPDIIYPDDLSSYLEQASRLLTNQIPSCSIKKRYIRKDGTHVWVSFTGTIVHGKAMKNDYFVAIVEDITELRADEEQRRDIEFFKAEKAKSDAIIEAIGEIMSIRDTDFRIIYQNKILTDLIGDHEGEYCYIAYEGKDHVCEGCPVAMSFYDGKIHTAQRIGITPHGLKYFELTASVIQDSTGKIIAGIELGKDITRQKNAEKALKESEEKYYALMNQAGDAILLADINGNLFEANKKAEELLGYTKEEILNMHIAQIHPEEELERTINVFNEIVQKGRAFLNDGMVLKKDGKIVPVDITGNAIEYTGRKIIMGIFRDITERKQMEKALRDSEVKYRNIVETANEGIWILDTSSKTSYVNSHITQMLGYTAEEMLGRHLFDFMDTDARIEAEIGLERRKKGIKEIHDFRFTRKDGTNLWAIISTNPIIDDKGHYAGALGMVTDISERKYAEEQIMASLREKEVLLREIHHRVKNNMQIISSLLNLQARSIEDMKYSDMLQDSRSRIMTMSLVHEKLYWSKDFTKINFKDYIPNLVNSIFQSYSNRSGNILLNLDIEDVELGIDSAIPCGLIINELITNSLKYAFPNKKKGEIKIVFGKTDGNKYEMKVSDNGIGIPENLDFKKTETLGLHLVSLLAQDQLSGKIYLDRSKGTEFIIRFGEGK